MNTKLEDYLLGQATVFSYAPYGNFARSVHKYMSNDCAHSIYNGMADVDVMRRDYVQENLRKFNPPKPAQALIDYGNDIGEALIKELQMRRAKIDANCKEKLGHVKPVVDELNDLTYGSSKEAERILHDATNDIIALRETLSKEPN